MIKKFSCYLLITLLLVLTGCNERELSFDRTYPDFAKVDEFREKRKLEINKEIPRSIVIFVPSTRNAKYARASQYCWDNYLDCDSRMKPIHPYDNPKIDLPTLITTDNKLQIYVDRNRGEMTFPTKIEAYTYDQNENLQLYQSFDIKNNKKYL